MTNNINTNTITMEQEIAQLREATNGMIVAFSLAYNNGPDIGVRRSAEVGKHDPRADAIIVNDHCWRIAGDILDALSYERFTSISRVFGANPKELIVRLRGQALVAGSMVQVDLGEHKVKFMYMLNPECGQLVLE